jgi:hypothetical protein
MLVDARSPTDPDSGEYDASTALPVHLGLLALAAELVGRNSTAMVDPLLKYGHRIESNSLEAKLCLSSSSSDHDFKPSSTSVQLSPIV